MSTDSLTNRIKRLLCENVAMELDYDEIGNGDALIEDLNLDSLQILTLITELESEFNFVLEDEDLDLRSFASIDAVAGLIETKLALQN